MSITPDKHAGLLIPLDMFRISQLAAAFAEVLVGKARNILDAKLVISRHPDAPILSVRITGHVVGDDPPTFWRENPELVALASRIFPRQVILYFADHSSPTTRREGFMVAQQGQLIGQDDASADQMPPGATEADWPVSRLCQQLRVPFDDLAAGFPDGPQVDVSLVEPTVDDQALLMTLIGQPPDGDEGPLDEPQPGSGSGPEPQQAPKKPTVAEDTKRRAKQQAEQEAQQQQRAAEVSTALPFARDELGIVVAPNAELSEPDILRPYIVPKIDGDLPDGLPRDLTQSLQGSRIDIVVPVEFMSEVFIENSPLSRPTFEQLAQNVDLGGQTVRAIEVLGPRLGYGTLLSMGKKRIFISRKRDLPLPAAFILERLNA